MRSILFFCVPAAIASIACTRPNSGVSAPYPGVAEPVPDVELTSVLRRALRRDPVVGSEPIEVSVVDGEVVLTGTVPSLVDKMRAGEVIVTFRGARSLANRIVVNAPSRPDAAIADSVNDAIERDQAARGASARATVSDGAVTIRGSASSPSQREVLSELASRVPGVKQVSLAVDVGPISRREAEISADVTERVDEDARLDGARVTARVSGRTVVLTGLVGSLFQHDAAVADALVAGVANVNADALRVDWLENQRVHATLPRPPPTDAAIADAVRRGLRSDVRLGAMMPSVSADHGLVTLTGPVIDRRAEVAADRDASRVRGVREVDDRMGGSSRNAPTQAEGVPGVVPVEDDSQVEGSRTLIPPGKIEERARENIFWDPRIGHGPITVAVAPDGGVTLTGEVDTWGEALAADADALLAGAAQVTNHIRVVGMSGR